MEHFSFIIACVLTLGYLVWNIGIIMWATYKFVNTWEPQYAILFLCMLIYLRMPSGEISLYIAKWCGKVMKDYLG